MDIMLFLNKMTPSFVSKKEVRDYPGIGKIAASIQCQFLVRGDTKEARIAALKSIEDRQKLGEQGKMPILHIFPEGCTTNGKIIKFKKGAFQSLRPVRPTVITYRQSKWAVLANHIGCGFLFHSFSVCMCGFIRPNVDLLPVFAPNDFFWKNHWQEGKEEKWECFARVVREIIASHGGFETSELGMEDKFVYRRKLKELHAKVKHE